MIASSLGEQMKRRVDAGLSRRSTENFGRIISTGSTLLDLAISGGRARGGGMPGGILVEIFGPSGCGKTVLLCEIAGRVQRQGGQIMFRDPEARLNKQFARMFRLDTDKMEYSKPSTVPEIFKPVRAWNPEPADKVHGVFADSLAALTTEWEMEDKDKHGMRRAKEFSEQMRLTCRTLTERNFLMVCSNQIRQNLDAGPYGQKYISPGGEAIGFYSSLRLRCQSPQKIKRKQTIQGKEIIRTVGVTVQIEVHKSSVWKPFHTAPLTIIFDYGIDDIRENLQFVKDSRGLSSYQAGERKVGNSIERAINTIEQDGLEDALRDEVIDVWEEIEKEFESKRKEKL